MPPNPAPGSDSMCRADCVRSTSMLAWWTSRLSAGRISTAFTQRVLSIGTRKTKFQDLVTAAGWQQVRLFGSEHEVGLAELPSGSELRCHRKVARLAFFRALLDPLLNDGDLFGREAALIGEREVPRPRVATAA